MGRKTLARKGWLGAALAVAVTVGLAPSTAGAQTFRVDNRTGESVRVLIDGRSLGVVPQRSISSFGVAPGRRSFLLVNLYGGARARGAFALGPRGSYTYTLLPRPTPRAPTAIATVSYRSLAPSVPTSVLAPSYLAGSVQVRNHYPFPTLVWVGRVPCGRIQPGQISVCPNVRAGPHSVVAHDERVAGQELARQTVTVAPGLRQHIDLMPPAAPAPILMTGAAPAMMTAAVAPEAPVVMAPVAAPVVAPVAFLASTGALRIVNRWNEVLTLTLNGEPAGQVFAGQERYLPNVPAGTHQLVATTASGLLRSAGALAVRPGETGTWVP